MDSNTNGPGLGLTFCKSMIEELEGEIWFSTEPGKGTTFYIKFPVQISESNNLQSSYKKSTESVLIEKLQRL